MHILEHYLSPQTCAVMTAAMTPVWACAVKRVKTEITKERMPLLGICAAFSFVGMMFNVPMPGGTTGHAVGGTLVAILIGPDAACLSVTIALLIQALLFGDGGILAFGANCFNMAFVLPYTGYAVYGLIHKGIRGEKGRAVGAAIGAYAGINAAALFAAVELGLQPYLFHVATGEALYCPYDLTVSVPAMMAGHLTVFGLAEVIFTVAILAFVEKTSPDILRGQKAGISSGRPLVFLLMLLVCMVPIGLVAEGTAWGEWSAEEIAAVTSGGQPLGYTPSGMRGGFELAALMPDYTLEGIPDAAAYIVSAVVGAAAAVIVFRLIAAAMRGRTNFDAEHV